MRQTQLNHAVFKLLFCFIIVSCTLCLPQKAHADGGFVEQSVAMVSSRAEFIRNHEHQWEHSKCTICGLRCWHSEHNIDGYCLVCGHKTYHKYNYGLCRCGKVLQFREELLPDYYYFDECEEQGTLHPARLEGQLSDVSPTIAGKKFEVYLPYGYDETRPYDVMFLQGGLGSHHNAMTSQTWFHVVGDRPFCFKNIWDHMIYEGICEPMIIVSVDGYSAKHGAERYRDLYEETSYFVQNYIYQYVIEHYSTYAKSTDPDDIVAARDHFGYGGFSNGGWMTYWGAMNGMVWYCSNFLPMGGSWRADEVAATLYQYKDVYPVSCFFAGAGINDGYSLDQMLDDYITIVNSSESLYGGDNTWFITVDYAHDYNAASILLYDGLQVMFPLSE